MSLVITLDCSGVWEGSVKEEREETSGDGEPAQAGPRRWGMQWVGRDAELVQKSFAKQKGGAWVSGP